MRERQTVEKIQLAHLFNETETEFWGARRRKKGYDKGSAGEHEDKVAKTEMQKVAGHRLAVVCVFGEVL